MTGGEYPDLGYDGQYTNADTGLIYLRARSYDPITAQFLSVDPQMETTGTIYGYAENDPLVNGDPTGECRSHNEASGEGHIKSCGKYGMLFVDFTTTSCDKVQCRATVTVKSVAARGVTQRINIKVYNPAFPRGAEYKELVKPLKSQTTPPTTLPLAIPYGTSFAFELELTRGRHTETLTVVLAAEEQEIVY